MKKKVQDPRPSWDAYFMELARVVATRSNCSRRHVGAVIVRNRHILSTGYNGTPYGVKNCFEGGCPRCAHATESGKHLDECLCVHAEQNAICQAAQHGHAIDGATAYVTISPCLTCAKLLINAGIREVVYAGEYAFLDSVKDIFRQAGVKHRKFRFQDPMSNVQSLKS